MKMLLIHIILSFGWLQVNPVTDEPVDENYKLMILLVLAVSFISFLAIIFIIKSRNAIKSQLRVIEKQSAQIEEKNTELAYSNESLKELNTEKNSVISVVAHDLKTPFGNIEGLANLLLLNKDQLNEEQIKYIKMILEASKKGKDLVENVLDVHKIESQIESMNLVQQDVIPLIEDVINQHSFLAKERGVNIDFTGNLDLEQVRTDTQYFKLIVSNLLANSVKLSPKSSEVHLLLQDKGQTWSMSFADEGTGLSERELQRLMAPYANGSSEKNGHKNGEAQNLKSFALTRKLIEKLNGKIRVKSEVDKGSIITIEFLK